MNYLLREVPDDVWRQVKAVAALRGTTVRELIIASLRDLAAADRGEPNQERPAPRRRVPAK